MQPIARDGEDEIPGHQRRRTPHLCYLKHEKKKKKKKGVPRYEGQKVTYLPESSLCQDIPPVEVLALNSELTRDSLQF